jgi:hypothetical protein
MDKQIPAFLLLNKSIALFVTKPLYDAICQNLTPFANC